MVLPGAMLPPAATHPVAQDDVVYARWSRRVVGDLLDGSVIGGVTFLALGATTPGSPVAVGMPLALDADASWHRSWWVAGALLVVLTLQAWTGWTPGKLVVGIAVVSDRDGRPVGLPRTLLRWVLHVLDVILFIGYLRPLWHRERRTFADSLARTVVVRRRPRGLGRGNTSLLTGGALVLCLVGAGLAVPRTWTSSGDPAARGEASCSPSLTAAAADLVADVSPAQVTAYEAHVRERRLWSSRVVDVFRSYTAAWTWSSASAGGDLALELVATGPDGQQATHRVGIAGRTTEVDQVDATIDGGTVSAWVDVARTGLRTSGPSWT